ncbi:MAG: prepilin-type N-terminal cleavage/methylation domain-containing protein [bacterium]
MNRKGFVLLELAIVVAIIAILAAIAASVSFDKQERSKIARAKADMRSMGIALDAYATDHNRVMTAIVLGTASSLSGRSVFDPSVLNAVSPRFIRLTTPVAYMSKVLRDPFAEGIAKGGVSDSYDAFDYLCAYDFAPGGKFDQTTANWRGAGITSGGGWRLSCLGPDRIQGFGGGYVNQFPSSTQSLGLDYDPTNGTISRGDIVRVGGGIGPISGPARLPSIDRSAGLKYNQVF